ncbi:hypothetical protein TGPRC2_310118A, partial [Toxoplasma gondii TgCatPRC2]
MPVLTHCSLHTRGEGDCPETDKRRAKTKSDTETDGEEKEKETDGEGERGECGGGVGVEDVGRFRLFDRHRLVELLPEGLA